MSQAGEINSASGPVPPTVPTSFVTDSGTAIPAANILNVLSKAASGGTLLFSGSGNTVTLNSTSAKGDTIIGLISGNPVASLLGGNTGVGFANLSNLTTGSNNSAFSLALQSLTTGVQCTAIGFAALNGIITGSYSTALGTGAGQFNTAGDSSNIYLVNGGVSGESHTMRLGTQGNGNANVNRTFIAGIIGITNTSAELTTINSSTGQMGVVASVNDGVLITSNTGIPSLLANGTTGKVLTATTGSPPSWQSPAASSITIAGDTGTSTGSSFTIETDYGAGDDGTASFTSGAGIITFVPYDAHNNIVLGNLSGNFGGALGTSTFNSGYGYESLNAGFNGSFNTAMGYRSGYLQDGSYNTLYGYNAGSGYTGSESSNICLGAAGTASESHVMRLGTTGSGNAQVNTAFLAATNGVTVSNPLMVVMNSSTEQLGTATIPISAVTWSVITADQTAAVQHGYICNKGSALLLALPVTSAVGDIIRVTGINTALGWKVTQASGQQIFFGNQSTTLGATGFMQSAATRDTIEMVCITANTTWQVLSSVGNITVS